MKINLLSLLLMAGSALISFAPASGNELEATRNVLDQWVETHQIISEEKADWKTEKSILGDTLELLSNEVEHLEKTLADLSTLAGSADREHTALTAKKEKLSSASAQLEVHMEGLETQIKRIIRTLPKPLIEKITPLIRRLPDDSATAEFSLGERIQNVVGILSQTDKFNTTITRTSESRKIDNGKVMEVRTLYWGLAMAYYVDASGQYAGIGFPTSEGWQWPQVNGAGPDIKKLIDVYEGDEDVQFISVPAQIK